MTAGENSCKQYLSYCAGIGELRSGTLWVARRGGVGEWEAVSQYEHCYADVAGGGRVQRRNRVAVVCRRGVAASSGAGDADLGGGSGRGRAVYLSRADDPNRLQGFEVELAELIAEHLGVQPKFAQGQWDKLPDLLDRGDIDIVLNGYEWTPNRADATARRFRTTSTNCSCSCGRMTRHSAPGTI